MNAREFVGKQIAKKRKELSLTQSELAKRCGIQRSTLSKIESGYYSASIDALYVIAQELECDLVIPSKVQPPFSDE